MTYLRYFCVALSAALVAIYSTLWVVNPAPLEHVVTLPPLKLYEQDEELVLWGGWRTVAGYEYGSANAVELRCNRKLLTCVEAYASILHHNAGEDLEAQVFSYKVDVWDEQRVVAIAVGSMAECLDRVLQVDLAAEAATLEWRPGGDGCEGGDVGKAVLIGDPV